MQPAWHLLLALLLAISGSATPWEAPEEPEETTSESSLVPRRKVTAELFLNNGLDYGEWGPEDYCPEGSFAHAFEVKFEPYSSTDETAVNGVKLYCSTPPGHDTAYVTSTEGQYGDWLGMRVCEQGFLTALRANVLEAQGVLHDDVGLENVELECNYGDETILGVPEERFNQGEWSRWAHCFEESAICGLQVRYEEPYLGDDSGTTDLVMWCCDTNAKNHSGPYVKHLLVEDWAN